MCVVRGGKALAIGPAAIREQCCRVARRSSAKTSERALASSAAYALMAHKHPQHRRNAGRQAHSPRENLGSNIAPLFDCQRRAFLALSVRT